MRFDKVVRVAEVMCEKTLAKIKASLLNSPNTKSMRESIVSEVMCEMIGTLAEMRVELGIELYPILTADENDPTSVNVDIGIRRVS